MARINKIIKDRKCIIKELKNELVCERLDSIEAK